jgi:Tol biopolymer transport system component
MSEVHDRLDSWKAIAEYLDRDPTTVMRWAKERGLPVYVVPGQGQRHRAVYAYKGEIDAWLKRPAPLGLRVDERKNQSEIPPLRSAQGRNDNRPLEGLAERGGAARQNDQHDQVERPEEAHAEEASDRAGPQDAGVSVDSPNRTLRNAPALAGRYQQPSLPGHSREGGNPDFRKDVDPRLRGGDEAFHAGVNEAFHGGGRWGLWAVFLGGALLIALGAGAWLEMAAPEPKVLGFEQLTNDGFEKGLGLATDGARVYFIENSRDGYVVAEIPSTGGSPVAIARATEDSAIQDISPDRTELLLIREAHFRPGSVWILPLLAGSARRLGTTQAFSAAWSPDGARLAYTTDDGLYLCDANGLNSRRIAAMSGRLDSVRWSPEGRELSFKRYSSKEATFWSVDREGKGLCPLRPDLDIPRDPAPCFWTPDGKYLILPGSYAGHEAPWALRVSTGLLRRNEQATCLSPSGLDLRAAIMSPDGSRLYCIGGTMSRCEIERFDARSEQLVPFLPDVQGTNLDFTKDGGWVAYVDDHYSLWKIRNGGGEKVQLTLPPLEVELPRWSPDGKRIAFMGRDPGQPRKVRVVSAEGGPYEPVTSTEAAEGAPTWSPDGSQLLFGGLVDPAERASGPLVIHVFDSKERRLSVVPGSEGLWTARWSPDGRYIAALTEDARSLMLFDFRTGKWTKVLALGQIMDLRWSGQGKSIYLNAESPEGEPALYRVEVPGHQAERLISLKGTQSSRWLGLAPDDSPLVVRPLSSAEIYALECQFPK